MKAATAREKRKKGPGIEGVSWMHTTRQGGLELGV